MSPLIAECNARCRWKSASEAANRYGAAIFGTNERQVHERKETGDSVSISDGFEASVRNLSPHIMTETRTALA